MTRNHTLMIFNIVGSKQLILKIVTIFVSIVVWKMCTVTIKIYEVLLRIVSDLFVVTEYIFILVTN